MLVPLPNIWTLLQFKGFITYPNYVVICSALCLRDMDIDMYLVVSAFNCSTISLLDSNKASVFLLIVSIPLPSKLISTA